VTTTRDAGPDRSPGVGARPATRSRLRAAPAAATTNRAAVALATALAVTLAGGLAGCTGSDGSSRPGGSSARAPGADEVAREAAAKDAGDLLLLARRAASGTPALAPAFRRMAAVQQAHLTALGAPVPAAPSASTSPSATSSATAAAGAVPAAGPKDVLAAEWAAASRALGAATGTGPAMATLLVRIAAGRAVDGDLLARAAKLPVPGALRPAGGTTSGATASAGGTTGSAPTGATASAGSSSAGPSSAGTSGPAGSATANRPERSAGSRQALNDLLVGEHAAAFAYGLLAARAGTGQQDLAQGLWQEHLVARDYLESQIVAVGDSPPVPEPAYDVGPAPSSTQQVASLAGRVERALASVAATAVSSADPDVRPLAADYLVQAARRAARWGSVQPLPGEPAPPASGGASASGDASGGPTGAPSASGSGTG
jgi:hypothetical protein